MAAKRGLDNRARDASGRIREKSGTTKMATLAKEYPEMRVFTPSATLSGIRARYGVQSIEEVRAVAAKKLRERKKQ